MARQTQTVLVACAALAAALLCMLGLGVFEPLERAAHDALQSGRRAGSKGERHKGIVVVAVTDDCVERYGPWPWPRGRVAELIDAIAAAGARVIAIDVLFVDAEAPGQGRLARSIKDAGNVVLAAEVVRRTAWDDGVGGLAAKLELQPPAAELAGAAAALGFVNVDYYFDNQDGVVRKMPLMAEVEGGPVPVLALAAAARFTGEAARLDPAGRVWLGHHSLPVAPAWDGPARAGTGRGAFLEVPLPASAYLDFREARDKDAIPTLRAVDVLSGNVPTTRFKDRVVLLGIDARGLDRKVTPVGHLAGVELQAQLVANLLDGTLLTRAGPGAAALGLVLALGLGAGLALRLTTPQAVLAGVGLGAVGLLAARTAFERFSLLPEVAAPLIGLATGVVGVRLTLLALERARSVRHMAELYQSAARFSRTLDRGVLEGEICARYRDLTGATGVTLVYTGGDAGDVEGSGAGTVPEPVRAVVGRRRLQAEACKMMRVADGALPAARLAELADYPEASPLPAGSWVLPVGRFEEPTGFVLALGVDRPLVTDPAEAGFWATHANLAATALENAGLYRLATVDALTGLYLRHFFDAALAREFSRVGRYQGHLALLMTDIDRFKGFNDTHGHQVGDRVLRFVAEKVREAVRGVDLACRYGGEEFAVILPETDLEGAKVIAERIRKKIEESGLEVDGLRLSVTISVGVACTERTRAKSPSGLVEEADQAMYRAKQEGRNRVEVARV